MNTSIFETIGWVLAGMLLMGIIVWITMPSLMMIKSKSKFSYDETIALLSEGFTKKPDWLVKNYNDYQKSTETFSKLERIGSLNICNPRHAAKILTDDKNRGVTSIMPLALGVYENKNGQVFISKLNIGILGKMFGGTISEVMSVAGKEVNEVIQSVSV